MTTAIISHTDIISLCGIKFLDFVTCVSHQVSTLKRGSRDQTLKKDGVDLVKFCVAHVRALRLLIVIIIINSES